MKKAIHFSGKVKDAELSSNAAELKQSALSVTEVKKLYAGCKLAVNTATGYIIPKNTIPIGRFDWQKD